MLPAGAPVLAPAATRSSSGEPAANAAAPLGRDLLSGGRGYSVPLDPIPDQGQLRVDLPTLITRGSRRVLLTAGYLWTAARILLVTAALVVTSLGVTQSTTARAAAGATASAKSAKVAKRLRLHAWHWAMHQRGKPYIWGGTGPKGFDCSGLVFASYRARGVHLPRTTYGMLHSKHLIRIRKSKAREGDLAFFGSGHVELYGHRRVTFGAADAGSLLGFHRMNRYWHPTMYFRVKR
jgi:NlpC/P60 family